MEFYSRLGQKMSSSLFKEGPFSLRWMPCCFLLFAGCLAASVAQAQEDYFPDHPVVKEMADKAVARLQNTTTSKIGERTLAALAIVQHSKRYTQTVPQDNPYVNRTIDLILNQFPDDPEEDDDHTAPNHENIMAQDEFYYPALAMILLCETNAKKYKEYVDRMLVMFEKRQRPNGAFTYYNQPTTGDTSQTQYAALAMFVAKQNGFTFNLEVPKKALNWLCISQQNDGTWRYKLQHNNSPDDPGVPGGASRIPTLSIHTAGAGTVYLLADLLQLTRRKKSMNQELNRDIGLPRTVTIYVPPALGEDSMLNKKGPLVQFQRGKIGGSTSRGNVWLEKNYSVTANTAVTQSAQSKWDYYYLYALERYAYFREQAEGDVGRGKIKNWYNEAVEFLKSKQSGDGMFQSDFAAMEPGTVSTAFGVLVLVRSSEILVQPSVDSQVLGGRGFDKDKVLRQQGGKIVKVGAEKTLNDTLSLLNDKNVEQEQLKELTESLKKQVVEFRQRDDKSRGEIKAFLRSMVKARSYYRRLIAVRFLAGEQDMDNVPALLYALGDPDFRICLEAHNGLRLVSRKIDSLNVSSDTLENAMRDPDALALEADTKSRLRIDFDRVKKEWTEWYLKIRPNAELFD